MLIIHHVRKFFTRPLSLPAILAIFGFVMVLFLITVILFTISWRTAPLTMADLVGTYTLDYKTDYGYLGKETLILKADGTYIQIYTPAKGTTVKNNGTWELYYINGQQIFGLNDHMEPMDEWGKPNKIPFPRSSFSTKPTRIMGKIIISRDPNFDQYYHKIK
jgi:hypothetical protein